MTIRYRKNSQDTSDNNIFWTTMSDLMLGLAIIFITMFVLAMTGFTQEKIEQQKVKSEIAEQISKELQENHIDAKIDKTTGDLEIPAAALFSLNSYVLTPDGKQLLSKLVPLYVDTLFSKKALINKLESISIVGHTDSQTFAGVKSKDLQFIRNMDLSLKRANTVAEFILQTGYNKKNADALRKMIVVEGKSFNEPVLVNGKEDYEKSRRVILKLKVREFETEGMFGLTLLRK